MADISKIKTIDGTTYDIKDATARAQSGVTGVKGNSESSYRTGNVNVTAANVGAVAKAGDTMTGKLTLQSNKYTDAYNSGALDLKNSNIDGVNGIYTADSAENGSEGINFYRNSTHVDSLHARDGVLYFTPNRPLGEAGTANEVIVKNQSTFQEAYLQWGGRNFSASYGCIDASMIPELGANRLAFAKPEGVTVEYTRDAGETWTDYGATDAQKTALFSEVGTTLVIGKADSSHKADANYMLRVTLTTNLAYIYTVLHKFAMYISTNGSTGAYVSIDIAKKSSEDTWVNLADKVGIGGWSGYNIINVSSFVTYGNDNSQYSKIRFTFGCTGGSTTYTGLQVYKIYGFGGVGWTCPSTMAKYGRMYTYDAGQNVTFPAKVTASEMSAPIITTGSTASSYFQSQKFRGQGNADSYYHAVDFGYGGHDQVDFYEYGGKFNFHKHTGASIDSGDTLLGSITTNGWEGNVVGNVTGTASNVTGTVSVANGGTGKTTANDAANNLISGLPAWTANPTDDTYFVRQDTGGTSTFGRVKFSTLWNYIKGKFSGTSPITFSNGAIGINTASTSGYGATKLSTATNSTAVDVAATPSAVKTAYDLANSANTTANTALSGVNGNLIYDQTFTISNGVATFTPHVYQKGAEVTTNYAASCFKWKYRLIDGSEVSLTTNSNRGCTVTISGMGYGGHVIGIFTPA